MKIIIYYLHRTVVALLLTICLFSCNKLPSAQELTTRARSVVNTLSISDTSTAYKSVILSMDQNINPSDSGFHISASAVFIDSATGNMANISGLSINSRSMTRSPDSTFHFSYSDSTTTILNEGLSLAGTMVSIKTTGISPADTVTQAVYMPKAVLRSTTDWPIMYINVLNNQTITWVPDASNPTGQVMIKMWYSANASRFMSGDNTLPTTDKTLTYTVADNGSYTIPSTDLQGFKNNSYVWLSLGRGDQVNVVLPVSHQSVYYFTASSGTTNAMYVQCATNWQNTSTPVRCKSGSVTGEQEQEQQDLSVCSSTYSQTRWVVVGTNLTACPACNSGNCSGSNHKCINGACQTGTFGIISQVTSGTGSNTKCTTTYGYFFSDGTHQVDHTVVNGGVCP